MPRSALTCLDTPDCVGCGDQTLLLVTFFNLLLAGFLAVVGLVSGSEAILVSSLYSIKDFITSLVAVIGLKVSEKPADWRHPYGYGKIEFVAMLLIGVVLIIASLFLFFNSIKDVWEGFQGRIPVPNLIAVLGGAISVIANFRLYRYWQCVGTRRNSPAILSNANHHHSDTFSALFVVLAVIGSNLGFLFLDPLVAVIETIDLMYLSGKMLKEALQGTLDSAVNPEVRKRIESVIRLVPGVRRVSKINARRLGHDLWIDLTLMVDFDLSAAEGYQIGLQVRDSLMKAIDHIAQVNFSIEPYRL
ncbi:MAG: cation transporter [Deltaproteobacteria bacterium]|nr:cation transporter [Deltaproteobacteria bacterium]